MANKHGAALRFKPSDKLLGRRNSPPEIPGEMPLVSAKHGTDREATAKAEYYFFPRAAFQSTWCPSPEATNQRCVNHAVLSSNRFVDGMSKTFHLYLNCFDQLLCERVSQHIFSALLTAVDILPHTDQTSRCTLFSSPDSAPDILYHLLKFVSVIEGTRRCASEFQLSM